MAAGRFGIGDGGLHRREVLRLRVPALRAKEKARDASLRMTAIKRAARV
jgi:hypothetical protein